MKTGPGLVSVPYIPEMVDILPGAIEGMDHVVAAIEDHLKEA